MTGQEVAFLLLGMLVGSGIGATIAIVVRRRSEPKREVRVTVSPNAIPRRPAATLSHEVLADPSRPARGGPADAWPELAGDALPPLSVRTPVRSIMGPALVFATPAGAAGTAGMVPVPMGGPTGGREQLLGSLTRRSQRRSPVTTLRRSESSKQRIGSRKQSARRGMDSRVSGGVAP